MNYHNETPQRTQTFSKIIRTDRLCPEKRTIMPGQIKALSEMAHNIIKFRITLMPSEKVLLRRSRHQLYILGDRTLGYQRKVEALDGKQKFIHTLLKITLAHLKSELE